MKNIFTIDLEEWFHANYEDNLFSNSPTNLSLIDKEADRLLEIFNIYNIKATFFVLGFVAETHPEVIKKIASEGHEIASHGYSHQLVYKQNSNSFFDDVYKSKQLLEQITGKKIYGYRAPSWSITENSLWALDILEKLEFTYTSSIFPTKNYLYGIPYAPRFIHNCDVYGKKNFNLINIPPTTYALGKINIPFSGGAYFRLLPTKLINSFTKKINEEEKQPVIFYLHPREIDISQPHLKLNFRDYFIHYYGINSCEKKLTEVICKGNFYTLKDFVEEQS